MGLIGIPEKEIKATLANVDQTLAYVREKVLPDVKQALDTVDTLAGQAQVAVTRITDLAKEAEALVSQLRTLVGAIEQGGLTITLKAGDADPQ